VAVEPNADYEIVAAEDGYPADGFVPPRRAVDPYQQHWTDDATRGIPLS
jgi:hypothetical protein